MGADDPQASDSEARVVKALTEAEAARNDRRFDDGIALILEVLPLNLMADQLYFRLGNLFYDSGDLNQAEAAYSRAIEENPRHINAHYNLSAVYKKTGRLHHSVRMHKRAVKIQATGKMSRYLVKDEPPQFSGDDPAFRRWGRSVAFTGFLVLIGIAVLYLVAMYFLAPSFV